ncbi:MAG TPA: GlsB/YeaQ/YmgE family stress response membrane protein [Methylomirabilota bacterium]|nr:GlsB/YeaQ/YmgE family stress response membrane protein [Methylomirabilota bacterium]
MSFTMFVTWVLVGVLAGVLAGLVMKRGGYGLKNDIILGLVGSIGASWIFRASGLFPSAGIVAMLFVALAGAAVLIIAQRKLRPTERLGGARGDVWWRGGLVAAVVAVVAWMTLGPAPQPAATAAVVEEKTYTVTPAAMKVKAGIVTGEVTNMKVTEQVEQGSGRVVSAAKLTAIVTLKNSSENQTVRLVTGTIKYIDSEGQPIKLEDARTEPALTFATYGGSSDRLDPGQEAIQSLDVAFPAEALKAQKLKEIRLELAYIPSPYREETVQFSVSIGEGK